MELRHELFLNNITTNKIRGQDQERIFVRPKAVIGRTVENRHPPQSVHVVNQSLADFKAGVKNEEDFWISVKINLSEFAISS